MRDIYDHTFVKPDSSTDGVGFLLLGFISASGRSRHFRRPSFHNNRPGAFRESKG